MRKKTIGSIIVLMLVISLIQLSTGFATAEDDLIITITLTVEGEIQTDDPWTADLSKPMYYIWLDPNGDPNDARYANGAGSAVHEIRLDTGRLNLQVLNGDSTGWIYETSTGSKQWTDTTNNIQASITNNDKSLEVSFPLSLINSPSALDVSAMCSPYTSSAVDNTGADSGSSDGWIIISDATVEGSYEFLDVADENLSWPSSLSDSDRLPNFNIEKIEVTISTESTDTGTDETDTGDDTTTEDEDSDGDTTSGFDMWLILLAVIIICAIIILVVVFTRKKKK
jgi:hypothetical protein